MFALKSINILNTMATPIVAAANSNENVNNIKQNNYLKLVTNFVNEENELINKISEKIDVEISAKQNVNNVGKENGEQLRIDKAIN